MLITIAREPSANGWTLGRLGVDGRFECYTCEDVVRPHDAPKVPGQTAIPPGRYRVIITVSPRFGIRLPRLVGVAGFDGILIHTGNTARDMDGCILPGLDHKLDGVRQSRPAFDALMEKIETALSSGRQVWLEVFSRAMSSASRPVLSA